MCQWDKDSCDDAGFLKIDLLGLGMLSAVEECVEQIARVRGETIDLSRIPLDDPADLRRHPARRHRRRLPDREPRADAEPAAHAAREPRRPDRPGRPRPAGADPGQGRPPVHRAAPAAARGPGLRAARRPPVARRAAPRRRSASSSSRTRCSRWRWRSPGFTVGEAEGLRRAMSRKRSEEAIEAYRARFVDGARANGVDARDGGPRLRQARRLLGLRLPEVACRRVRPARLPVDLAAAPLPRRVPRRPPERAADGLLSAGQPRPRRAAAWGGGAAAGRQRERGEVRARGRRGADRARATCSRSARPTRRRSSRSGSAAGRSRAFVELAQRAAARPRRARGARRLRRLRRVRRAAPSCSGELGLVRARERSGHGRRGAAARAAARSHRRDPRPAGADAPGSGCSPTTGKTSLSVGAHPLELLRPHLPPGTCLEPRARRGTLTDGEVAVAGLAVARQRPATANGVVFMLLEDEHGQMNLIVPPPVYERYRPLVRGEPLLLARGKFERRRPQPERPRARVRVARPARPPRGRDGRERGATARAPLRAPLTLASFPPWSTRSSSPVAASHASVVRIGDTVHRPTVPWTPTIHAYLLHLEERGYRGAPRVLGLDDRRTRGADASSTVHGRELELVDAWARATASHRRPLRRGARRGRSPHPRAARRCRRLQARLTRCGASMCTRCFPTEILCHADLGPHNTVYRDGVPVAFIDWDGARPNEPLTRARGGGVAVRASPRRRVLRGDGLLRNAGSGRAACRLFGEAYGAGGRPPVRRRSRRGKAARGGTSALLAGDDARPSWPSSSPTSPASSLARRERGRSAARLWPRGPRSRARSVGTASARRG